MLLVAPLSHKHVRLAIFVAICFFPNRRETVTTSKGLLVPLDKLKLLLSNLVSLFMASLLWSLYILKLSFTMWSNLSISLRPPVRLYVSQLQSLASDKSKSETLVLLEALDLIFLIFSISQREPDFLEILYIILFCFLRAFGSFLHCFYTSYTVAHH